MKELLQNRIETKGQNWKNPECWKLRELKSIFLFSSKASISHGAILTEASGIMGAGTPGYGQQSVVIDSGQLS